MITSSNSNENAIFRPACLKLSIIWKSYVYLPTLNIGLKLLILNRNSADSHDNDAEFTRQLQ